MSMVSTIQDRAVGFLKAHPKATNAVCKVGEYATVGAVDLPLDEAVIDRRSCRLNNTKPL